MVSIRIIVDTVYSEVNEKRGVHVYKTHRDELTFRSLK